MRIVLASTSPARQALLSQVGLDFEAIAPGVEEHLNPALPAVEQARSLAVQKARAVAAREKDALVIGADQVMATPFGAFGKPATEAEALEHLRRLSGGTHSLITGVALIGPSGEWVGSEETRLTVRDLTEQELAAYVASGEWKGCAGGYRVEGRGLALFEKIEGDWTNVLGLPMPLLLGKLRERGVPLFP